MPYLVISKDFLRISYLVFSGFSLYWWMEKIHWRAGCGYYLSNLSFKQHPTPSSCAPWKAGDNNVHQESERPQASPKLRGYNHVAPYNLYGGRVNALNPQAGLVKIHSLPFVASRSDDRTGPAGVKTGQEILLFLECVTFQHWDEGVGGMGTPDRG